MCRWLNQLAGAGRRNRRNRTTDFTDFTDSKFSVRAALGTELAQKRTKATKKNSSSVSLVPFRSEEIRVIRAIRGKIFAKMSDSDRACSSVPSVPSCSNILPLRLSA
jgi:hypothetical protein